MVIDTPGMTAPDASCTTPAMVAVVTCAETVMPLNKIRLINSTGKYRDMFFLHSPHLKFLFVRRRDGLNATDSSNVVRPRVHLHRSPLAMTFTAPRETGFLIRAINSQD